MSALALGDEVIDSVTGFEGVAVAKLERPPSVVRGYEQERGLS